jgi:hypothetical protein
MNRPLDSAINPAHVAQLLLKFFRGERGKAARRRRAQAYLSDAAAARSPVGVASSSEYTIAEIG